MMNSRAEIQRAAFLRSLFGDEGLWPNENGLLPSEQRRADEQNKEDDNDDTGTDSRAV